MKKLNKRNEPPEDEDADFAAEWEHLLLPDGSLDLSGIQMSIYNFEIGEFEDDVNETNQVSVEESEKGEA